MYFETEPVPNFPARPPRRKPVTVPRRTARDPFGSGGDSGAPHGARPHCLIRKKTIDRGLRPKFGASPILVLGSRAFALWRRNPRERGSASRCRSEDSACVVFWEFEAAWPDPPASSIVLTGCRSLSPLDSGWMRLVWEAQRYGDRLGWPVAEGGRISLNILASFSARPSKLKKGFSRYSMAPSRM